MIRQQFRKPAAVQSETEYIDRVSRGESSYPVAVGRGDGPAHHALGCASCTAGSLQKGAATGSVPALRREPLWEWVAPRTTGPQLPGRIQAFSLPPPQHAPVMYTLTGGEGEGWGRESQIARSAVHCPLARVPAGHRHAADPVRAGVPGAVLQHMPDRGRAGGGHGGLHWGEAGTPLHRHLSSLTSACRG
jgi:hypothetical protein